MLSKKDKSEIRLIIQEELKACLGRTVTMERGPRGQGDPETSVVTEDTDIVSAMMVYLPRIEAAMRGVQEDMNRSTNRVNLLNSAILGFQQPLMKLAKIEAMIEDNYSLVENTAELIGDME